jgi:threonine synthase
MAGYQAAGAAPFVAGHPIDQPETVATAIRIGHPQSWDKAIAAQQESGGWFAALSDDEILAAQKLLAEQEGVFCEPASAASIGGALRDLQSGRIPAGKTLVCTLTGNGLKDPDVALRNAPDLKPVKADRATLEAAILRRLERA